MSSGLAPSRSTAYVSNLPFNLTNNDLHQLFEKYGKVVKVTVLKDKQTWKSKGVAFVLFLDPDSARRCVSALDKTELFGRTLKASIAKYNGRAPEFIKRKEYKDKSKCYECGEAGHLSYNCPRNAFGDREAPKKKEKKRKAQTGFGVRPKRPLKSEEVQDEEVEDESDEGEDPALESLSAAIKYEQMKYSAAEESASAALKRQTIKQSSYFSDEEEVDEDA
uniref:Zinc finger CCHC-type and RNA-binding motif-containing protein 1 n=1 Tax=Ornithodoros turicata TaxID=34597 RepID=A0A2R5LIK8_9ACAR